MADAGGAVYLLSSYQSGKERRGHVEEREGREEGGGRQKGNTLFQANATTFTCTPALRPYG